MDQQGFTSWEILEEHTDIYVASDREIELQKQYGLPVDKIPYWQSVENRFKYDGSQRTYDFTQADRSKGGKTSGRLAIESGRLHTSERQSENGKKAANKIRTCPHCNKTAKHSQLARWHFDNCKKKGSSIEKPFGYRVSQLRLLGYSPTNAATHSYDGSGSRP